MNQETHAWLAVEAYRLVKEAAKKDKSLAGLQQLLGQYIGDVVVASWLPDSLIKDMSYGHIFKLAPLAKKEQVKEENKRFLLDRETVAARLPSRAQVPEVAFPANEATCWQLPFKVKENGGHLPARVNALCQTARDMLNMGDDEVFGLSHAKKRPGASLIDPAFLYSKRDVALVLWMVSHYVADAHMPFHCDSRALASTKGGKAHSQVEEIWGRQLPELFKSKAILDLEEEKILNPVNWPKKSFFQNIKFGPEIVPMKANGDPWQQTLDICRASFAVSFTLVPETVARFGAAEPVDLQTIWSKKGCGKEQFWNISQAIMHDAANAIAMFWLDVWRDHCKLKKSQN